MSLTSYRAAPPRDPKDQHNAEGKFQRNRYLHAWRDSFLVAVLLVTRDAVLTDRFEGTVNIRRLGRGPQKCAQCQRKTLGVGEFGAKISRAFDGVRSAGYFMEMFPQNRRLVRRRNVRMTRGRLPADFL